MATQLLKLGLISSNNEGHVELIIDIHLEEISTQIKIEGQYPLTPGIFLYIMVCRDKLASLEFTDPVNEKSPIIIKITPNALKFCSKRQEITILFKKYSIIIDEFVQQAHALMDLIATGTGSKYLPKYLVHQKRIVPLIISTGLHTYFYGNLDVRKLPSIYISNLSNFHAWYLIDELGEFIDWLKNAEWGDARIISNQYREDRCYYTIELRDKIKVREFWRIKLFELDSEQKNDLIEILSAGMILAD